jgi:hypothetical protein
MSEFLHALEEETRARLETLAARSAAGDAEPTLSVTALLRLALRNELEAAELAARWMTTAPELDFKLALARQAGDEAKHFGWIAARLAELGDPPGSFDPRAGGPSPLFSYLVELRGTAERAAAGPFAREGIALVRNEVFVAFCQQRGDGATASLYRDRIQPDERHHHELGRELLLRYARAPEDEVQARRAALRTIEIADEIQELARLRMGVSRAPGC